MITLQHDGDLVELALDAPQRLNAIDERGLDELLAALGEAERARPRALLLRGEGRAFCAGRDVSAVDPSTDDVLGYLQGHLEPVLRALMDFPAPTIAAVQGACLGVGLGLALACDVVYVADEAKFGSPFANLGAVLDSGAHQLFVERLGVHRTLDLVYTGELVSGREAVAAGLFSRSVPSDELLAFAREKAARIAQGPTRAFLASKGIANGIRRASLEQVLGLEAHEQAAMAATEDYREGFAAFQQKRRPSFGGR